MSEFLTWTQEFQQELITVKVNGYIKGLCWHIKHAGYSKRICDIIKEKTPWIKYVYELCAEVGFFRPKLCKTLSI